MHLSQLKGGGVVVREGETARLVPGAETVLDLAHDAIAIGVGERLDGAELEERRAREWQPELGLDEARDLAREERRAAAPDGAQEVVLSSLMQASPTGAAAPGRRAAAGRPRARPARDCPCVSAHRHLWPRTQSRPAHRVSTCA